jgi:HK97 family phage major capsid protein
MKLKEKKTEIDIQLRSLQQEIVDGKITHDQAKLKFDELRAKKAEIEKAIALANSPVETRSVSKLADIAKAMIEKRSITLNGTGAIDQVKELAKELQAKTPLLNGVRYYYGANAATMIPVLSPSIATPAIYAEGATTIAEDTQAVLGAKTIQPYAWISLLPVSAEALQLGSVDVENELPAIFADSFAQGMHNAIATGSGTGMNFQGLFVGIPSGNQTVCGAAGAPKIADLVSLALKVKDYTDEAVIVLNPAIHSAVLADATTGVADVYKESLIRDKTIEGVRVILTGAAPSSTSAGATVAVAGRLSDYAVGMASEIQIEPIKKVGSSLTYFQATLFVNGLKPVAKNFYSLVAASTSA